MFKYQTTKSMNTVFYAVALFVTTKALSVIVDIVLQISTYIISLSRPPFLPMP